MVASISGGGGGSKYFGKNKEQKWRTICQAVEKLLDIARLQRAVAVPVSQERAVENVLWIAAQVADITGNIRAGHVQ